jgi:NAD dependent epimerase/dehydratase
MLEGKRVLVTGAGGFIGSHLVEHLVGLGARVRAFVKYNGRGDWGMLERLPAQVLEQVEVVAGDVRDPFFVRRAVAGCSHVFHLAALIGIPFSYHAPADYLAVNAGGTLNLLQACREEGVERLVHTSTSETYGTAQRVPIDEDHPLQAQSPYAASKIAADKMAEAFHLSFELPVVIVRPFNTFGPRQSARAFIPTVISQALTRPEVRLGSLEPVRDLTYVADTVEGMVQVGLCDRAVGRVVNLGTGQGWSVGEVARRILELVGRPELPIRQDPQRLRPPASEVMRLVSDNRLARELCGWQPRHSLDQGLTQTIAWVRMNLEHYRPEQYQV